MSTGPDLMAALRASIDESMAHLRSTPRNHLGPAGKALLGYVDPTPKDVADLLGKFANHRKGCGCFVCRTLTDHERAALDGFWHARGGRK